MSLTKVQCLSPSRLDFDIKRSILGSAKHIKDIQRNTQTRRALILGSNLLGPIIKFPSYNILINRKFIYSQNLAVKFRSNIYSLKNGN